MIRLFFNYYEDSHPERKKEIDLCLQKNLANTHFNTIIVESQSRMTYGNFFERINKIAENDDISIICNSDIFFDETIKLVSNIQTNECFALARWEWTGETETPVFCNRVDSQDSWIFKGKIKDNIYCDFHLGIAGCDNRIAAELQKAGYCVSNPALSVKSYHVHNTGIRTYRNLPTIPGPYLTLQPEKIK